VARPRRQPPRPIQLREKKLAEGEELVVYHLVPTEDREASSYLASFRSRAELGLPPRKYTQEAVTPRVNEGISAFTTSEAAAETWQLAIARGRDLGRFVATMRLSSGKGIAYAPWGPRGHLTVFGEAVTLSQTVTDIVVAERILQ